MCGEKAPQGGQDLRMVGSPPRVRGKVLFVGLRLLVLRITPACAGKRFTSTVLPSVSQDHPRVCGEKIRWSHIKRDKLGSPPRVRGKADGCPPGSQIGRITPACAGKRRAGGLKCGVEGDHPRVCGEKLGKNIGCSQMVGSPPRVRGKGRCRTGTPVTDRITPACAGKSLVVVKSVDCH